MSRLSIWTAAVATLAWFSISAGATWAKPKSTAAASRSVGSTRSKAQTTASAQTTEAQSSTLTERWRQADRCVGGKIGQKRARCEKQCEADGSSERRSSSRCRCKCTGILIADSKAACGELGAASVLSELGASAKACVDVALSPDAACILRCEDVLSRCMNTCYEHEPVSSESHEQSCVSGCFVNESSCLELCNSKATRPASFTNTKKR